MEKKKMSNRRLLNPISVPIQVKITNDQSIQTDELR